ncbi:MAG: phasin family protein [Steroidobacteraceae bacterium]|nr:phasin family protein [Steroidobacteraceae bacterium]
MVNKVIDFTSRLTESQFGKAARQSAERIVRVSREAIRTSGTEGRRVFTTVRKEGEKLQKFAHMPKMPKMRLDIVDQVQDAAFERIDDFEKAFQKRVEGVLKDLGIPTAKQVAALSRRVDELSAKVDARAKRVAKAPVRARRPAARKVVAPKAEAA